MTKRVLNTGLRHTSSGKEDYPVPKGFCRQSVNATTCYSNPSSQTSHIPIPNTAVPVFPPISDNPSSFYSMHQKPPTGLPIVSSSTMSPRPGLPFSAKNRVHPTATISNSSSSSGFHDMNSSLSMGSKVDHAVNNITLPESGVEPSPRTLRKDRAPSQMDAQFAYENMMLRYFVPTAFTPQTELLKTGACSTLGEFPLNHSLKTQLYDYIPSPPTHSISTMHMDLLPSPPNSTNSPASEPTCLSSDLVQQNVPVHHVQYQSNAAPNYGAKQFSKTKTQVALDITPSGCTVLEAEVFPTCESNLGTLLAALATEEQDFQNKSGACSESTSEVGTKSQSLVNETRGFSDNVALSPDLPTRNNFALIPQSRLATNTMSTVFMSPPEAVVHDSALQDDGNFMFPSESASVGSVGVESCISTTEHQDVKSSASWGRFSVLPPLSTSVTPGDSLMSCNSSLNSGQTGGMVHSSYSPFTAVDFQPAIYAVSPRSSFSGRGSRNKRALSNSPLSADGIDLNSIIRMSPTSLITYLNGSRSSSSCVSPGSAGERSGCYGHLSARNSSSSPRSGSGSSGAKRSISHTSITGSTHQQRETSVVNSNISAKSDLFDLENSMFVLQTMQELETNCQVENLQPAGNQASLHSTMVPECDNLRILPQDEAIYRCEEYLPYIPMNLQPVQNYCPAQQQVVPPSTLKTLLPPPNKPPPTYAQHMARKATLEKKSSSDSSNPSNSNSSSFESTEGGTGGGNSSTDSELLQTQQRMYECRWLDCSSVFQDLEEFVSHIEKQHMDQRKGEEFICFWRNCPRRMHPFNQRYKLLMHMRVHSGDKPNKCTYTGCKKAFSRLENLKIHMRSHTGERPYSCPYQGCNKTFSNSSDRAKHQKTHQDMRPYICQVPGCGKRYTDPSSLRKHAKGSHVEKKEPGRKKIRGGIEELDPKELNECLVIKGLKPIPQCDVSPPERTDSGLGKSPKGSHLGFLSDHYSSFGTSGDTSSRSGTAYGSNQTSPCSHHSSPRGLSDINESEKSKQVKESSLLVPSLPPIIQSPLQRNIPLGLQGYRSATHTPSLANSPRNGGSTSSSLIKSPKTISIANMTRELVVDTPCPTLNAANYSNQNLHPRLESRDNLLLDTFLDSFSRFEGVS